MEDLDAREDAAIHVRGCSILVYRQGLADGHSKGKGLSVTDPETAFIITKTPQGIALEATTKRREEASGGLIESTERWIRGAALSAAAAFLSSGENWEVRALITTAKELEGYIRDGENIV